MSFCENINLGLIDKGLIMRDMLDIDHLKQLLEEFSVARDWAQFHNPKNLSMALACEAGELLEIFRWMPEAESVQASHDSLLKEKTAEELADIILNATRIAALMKINLTEAIQRKMTINSERYPAALVKGSCKKYNEY
jgi:dCTP diphosphatase